MARNGARDTRRMANGKLGETFLVRAVCKTVTF